MTLYDEALSEYAIRNGGLIISWNGFTFNPQDLVSNAQFNALEDGAMLENSIGLRTIIFTDPSVRDNIITVTNGQYLAARKLALEALQKLRDGYNAILAQIDNGTITVSGQIVTNWNIYNASYVTNRVPQPTNEQLALSIAALGGGATSWHNAGSPNSGSRAIVTLDNIANGFQLSTTQVSSARYNVTLTTNPTLLAASSSLITAYVAPTNSVTPADWIKYDAVSFGLPSGVALSGVTSIQTLVLDDIPAGYWIRLRGTTVNGSTGLNSFREKY